MLLSTRHRIALLALPKTGTTALEAALRPMCDIAYTETPKLKHMTLRQYRRFVSPFLARLDVTGVETFCVVREPVDWLGSWWRYRLHDSFAGTPNSTRGVPFEAFVEAYLSRDRPDYAAIGRPSKFVADEGGRVGVDHLFKYVNLDAMVDLIGRRFETRLDIGRANASPEATTALSAPLRARLEDALAADFDLYHHRCR